MSMQGSEMTTETLLDTSVPEIERRRYTIRQACRFAERMRERGRDAVAKISETGGVVAEVLLPMKIGAMTIPFSGPRSSDGMVQLEQYITNLAVVDASLVV